MDQPSNIPAFPAQLNVYLKLLKKKWCNWIEILFKHANTFLKNTLNKNKIILLRWLCLIVITKCSFVRTNEYFNKKRHFYILYLHEDNKE